MKSHIWSYAERLTPRFVAAALMLSLAALTDPRQLGLYAWATLSYTALLALGEAPARQVLSEAVSSSEGRAELRRFRRWLGIGGAAAMAAAIVAITIASGSGLDLVLKLAPMCFAPAAVASGLEAVGRLQVADQWRYLAQGQAIAAIASVPVSLSILWASHSIAAVTIQAALTETCFALYCCRRARRFSVPDDQVFDGLRGAYRSMTAYSCVSWLQAQSDRVFVGILGGTALLGGWSVAIAFSRSIGDALAAATANLLRAELAAAGQGADVRAIAGRTLRRSVWLGTLAVIAAWTFAELVARPLLGAEWDETLATVPVLGLAVLPSCLAWSTTVLHVRERTGMRSLYSLVVGFVFAPFIGAGAVHDLRYAAGLVVLREFCLVVTAFVVVRGVAPWGALRLCALVTLACACAYLLLLV